MQIGIKKRDQELPLRKLPPLIDRELFRKLTKNNFDFKAYDEIADHDGQISKGRILELLTLADCYLSYEWGIDTIGRRTRERVLIIQKFLQEKGLFTLLDDHVEEKGKSRIKSKVEKCQCSLIFMTQRYSEKITDTNENPTKTEFLECLNSKGARNMIPVIFEEAAVITSTTPGLLATTFRYKFCLNMSSFEKAPSQLEDLYDYILKTIRPLKEGGSFRRQLQVYDTTVEGRHYAWLRSHIPSLTHSTATKHANALEREGVTSISKLWKLLQHDPEFLTRDAKIPLMEAKLIRNALKLDLISNTKVQNVNAIEEIIREKDEKNAIALAAMQEETRRLLDISTKTNESTKMSIEDSLSYDLRELRRREETYFDFEQARSKIIQAAKEQDQEFSSILDFVEEGLQLRQQQNFELWRIEEYQHISGLKSPYEVCVALRRLLLKIDKEIQFMTKQKAEGKDFRGNSTAPLPGKTAMTNKKSSFSKSIGVIELKRWEEEEDMDDRERLQQEYMKDVLEQPHEQHGSLVYLLQEAVFVSRLIVSLCEGNQKENVRQFMDLAVNKPLNSLVMISFAFSCSFESDFMPPDYQRLSMPQEVLRAVRYLCKCGQGRHAFNPRLSMLFVEAGMVGLCFDILKFHYKDEDILEQCLDLLCVVLDSRDLAAQDANLARFMGEENSLLMLMILLEKYDQIISECNWRSGLPAKTNRSWSREVQEIPSECEILTDPINGKGEGEQRHKDLGDRDLRVVTSVLNIISYIVKSGHYDETLRHHRIYFISDTLDNLFLLLLHRRRDDEDVEAMARLLICVSNVFFDRLENVVHHSVEGEEDPYSTAEKQPMYLYLVEQINKKVLGKFFTFLISTSTGKHEDVFNYLVIAVGDFLYKSNQRRRMCAQLGLHHHICTWLVTRTQKHFSTEVMQNLEFCKKLKVEPGVPVDDVTREILGESYLTLSNLVLLPSKRDLERPNSVDIRLPYDFNSQSMDEGAVEGIAGVEGTMEAVVVRQETRKTGAMRAANVPLVDAVAQQMVLGGLCEGIALMLHLFGQSDPVFTRRMLIFLSRLFEGGRYVVCQRFVRLGICKQIVVLMRHYMEDQELFLLIIEVLIGLSQSHPNLVGARSRLMRAGVCDALVSGMRFHCKVWNALRWLHFNFPYTCRSCFVHSYAIYCLVQDLEGAEAFEEFKEKGVQGMLMRAPRIFSTELLNDFSMEKLQQLAEAREVIPTSSSGEGVLVEAPQSVEMELSFVDTETQEGLKRITQGNNTAVMDRSVELYMVDSDESVCAELRNSASLPSEEDVKTAVVLHKPPEDHQDSIAQEEEKEGSSWAGWTFDTQITSRNVELVRPKTKEEKDEIMAHLFDVFKIK